MLVLDFDGTITDAEAEGAPFRAGYLEDLATLTGLASGEVTSLAEQLEAEIAADPDNHGWIYDGHIVAPSSVDPYLRMMPVARRLFDHVGAFPGDTDRSRLLDGILYKYNYQKTLTVFRDGARELLTSLRDRPTFVVTNSHTEPVRDKIRQLSVDGDLDWLLAHVHGRARKYVVDPAFSAVDEAIRLEGLSRPILLRRRHYHEALAALLAAHGRQWSELTVVGDIFELDLALPLAMGARVVLVVSPFTPAYERAHVERHPRAQAVSSLAELKALLSA